MSSATCFCQSLNLVPIFRRIWFLSWRPGPEIPPQVSNFSNSRKFLFRTIAKKLNRTEIKSKKFRRKLKTSVSVVCDVLWELFFSSFFLMNWSKFANNLFKSVFRRKDKLLFLHFKMVNYSTNLNLSLPWFSYNVAILPRQKYSKWSCFIISTNCE